MLRKIVCHAARTPNVSLVPGSVGLSMLNGDIVFINPVGIKRNWLWLENVDK